MAGFTDYTENLILNWLRGTAMPTAPTVYVGLFSTAPTETGGGTEVTTTIRTAGRLAAGFGAPTQPGGSIANTADISFGASVGSATVVAFALFDAVSGGNMLAYGTLGSSITVSPNVVVIFQAGQLTLTLD